MVSEIWVDKHTSCNDSRLNADFGPCPQAERDIEGSGGMKFSRETEASDIPNQESRGRIAH